MFIINGSGSTLFSGLIIWAFGYLMLCYAARGLALPLNVVGGSVTVKQNGKEVSSKTLGLIY